MKTADLDMASVINESRSEKLSQLLFECVESRLGTGGSDYRERATKIRLRELQIVILEAQGKPLDYLICGPDGA